MILFVPVLSALGVGLLAALFLPHIAKSGWYLDVVTRNPLNTGMLLGAMVGTVIVRFYIDRLLGASNTILVREQESAM